VLESTIPVIPPIAKNIMNTSNTTDNNQYALKEWLLHSAYQLTIQDTHLIPVGIPIMTVANMK